MQVSPIKTESDYAAAMRRIESVWGAAPGTPEGDELEVLATLAEAYERQHYPVDLPDPVEAIKFRLEQEGKDYNALIGIIGQRTRVYEVMRRARPLSLNMIRKLHSQLEIPAEVLIQPVRNPGRRPSMTRSARSANTGSRRSTRRSA
jgi:HTH-type transcriptional regulator/antitoxin HigA